MLPRRIGNAKQSEAAKDRAAKKKPTLEEFLSKNDWSGALGLLQFQKNTDPKGSNADTLTMWMVYCAFHLGDYKRAILVIICLCNFPICRYSYCFFSCWTSWFLQRFPSLSSLNQFGTCTEQFVSFI